MTTEILRSNLKYCFDQLDVRPPRTIHQFAEEEIVLPVGPRKNMYFDIEYMPFTRFVFDAFTDDRWRKIVLTGPTQMGKSTYGVIIPILYFLFELEEDVILGAPTESVAKGMYVDKILPIIRGNLKFKKQLPLVGSGSRSGVPSSSTNQIIFEHGPSLRFMTAGGSDANMSSHTSRIIALTEVDKMDDIKSSSDESDPVSQMENRASAFEDRKLFFESTPTTESGVVWVEAMVTGSGGQIFIKCSKCKHYQTLKKEGLIYEDTDEVEAKKTARYRCEKCEKLWNDNDRLIALEKPLIVHRGQRIEKGKVLGDLPKTFTFGLQWNVLYSPMTTLGTIATEQLKADKSESEKDKKKMVLNRWGMPWKDDQSGARELTFSFLTKRQKKSTCELLKVPEWTEYLIMTVDVQERYMYWHVDAWDYDNTSKPIEYGTISINGESDMDFSYTLDEINKIRLAGWKSEVDENKTFVPKGAFIDTGHKARLIYPWLINHPTWRGVKGVGWKQGRKMSGYKAMFEIPGVLQIRRQSNGINLWFIDVDQAKLLLQTRYFIEEGNSGHTYVPKDVSQTYKRHLTSEIAEYKNDQFIGYTRKPGGGRNDYLDCRAYSTAGALYFFYKHNETKIEERQVKTKERKVKWREKHRKRQLW